MNIKGSHVFVKSLAESFYYVKYGLSENSSENLSENLSNKNKHSEFPENFSILIHMSGRQQKHRCLFSLLRISDKFFDLIIDDPYLTL